MSKKTIFSGSFNEVPMYNYNANYNAFDNDYE